MMSAATVTSLLLLGSLFVVHWQWQWSNVTCTVDELLSTKLSDVHTKEKNRAMLSAFGHTEPVLRLGGLFVNMTQRDRIDGVIRSLRCVDELLNDSERWWVMAGSLVGVDRHNALAPHDEDADVMLPRTDFQRWLARLDRMKVLKAPSFYSTKDKEAWRLLGPTLAHYSDGERCAVMKKPEASYPALGAQIVHISSGFYTDVWFGEMDSRCVHCSFCVPSCVPLDVVFPLKRARLGPLTLPVPNRIKEYLAFEYPDFEHPCSKLMQLALFTRLPNRAWLVSLLLVSVGSCVRCALRSRRAMSQAVLVVVVGLWKVLPHVNCAGLFACLGALYAAAILCTHAQAHAGGRRDFGWMVGMCATALLLFGCVFPIRTFLAMVADGYQCQSGKRSAWLLDLAVFDVDYRSFWNGTN